MKTITFNTELAVAIETSICNEFGCGIREILGLQYTVSKKVIVFIFSKYVGYTNRIIGHKYQLSHLYVPTVVREIEYQYKVDLKLRAKIDLVLNKIGYKEKLWESKKSGLLKK